MSHEGFDEKKTFLEPQIQIERRDGKSEAVCHLAS